VPAQVGNDHAVGGGKVAELALEEAPAHAPAVDEDDRRVGALILNEERDVTDAQLPRHLAPLFLVGDGAATTATAP
jgi:hypothetical protein